MSSTPNKNSSPQINRRHFFKAFAATGASLALARVGSAQEQPAATAAKPKSSDDLNIAIVGCGVQGRVLMESCLRIPGIRFQAVADIWEYNRGYAQRALKAKGHIVNAYENFEDLLKQEKGLDALVCATPDWVHHAVTNAALESG